MPLCGCCQKYSTVGTQCCVCIAIQRLVSATRSVGIPASGTLTVVSVLQRAEERIRDLDTGARFAVQALAPVAKAASIARETREASRSPPRRVPHPPRSPPPRRRRSRTRSPEPEYFEEESEEEVESEGPPGDFGSYHSGASSSKGKGGKGKYKGKDKGKGKGKRSSKQRKSAQRPGRRDRELQTAANSTTATKSAPAARREVEV